MAGVETVNFPANTVIFKEGDKPDGVYFVLSGNVEISRMEGKNKIVLANFGADAVFGEMALIDNQPRSASVITLAPTQCYKGTAENFATLMSKTDPEVKQALQRISTVVREKNRTKKAQMTQTDIITANALKQKADQVKQQILGNTALLEKIQKLDPFLNGVFNSLIQLLMA